MNNKLLLLLFLVSFFFSISVFAQQTTDYDRYVQQRRQEFEQYRQKRRTEFENYRAQRNKEFANYLAQRWIEYQHYRGVEAPPCPDPLKPVIKFDDGHNTLPVKLPVKGIVTIPKPQPRVPLNIMPDTPAPLPGTPSNPLLDQPLRPSVTPVPTFNTRFYGTLLKVRLEERDKFTLSSVDENVVSAKWKILADGRMDKVVDDCLAWREAMHLSDYAYVQMLGTLCNAFFGGNYSNEAVLMRVFLLAQSGYDVKCARKGSHLVLLLAIEEDVYEISYLKLDGKRYYTVDDPKGTEGYYTFPQKFSPQSQSCSVMIREKIELMDQKLSPVRRLISKRYPQLSVETQVDQNLMDLYSHYPSCKWDMYANTPMSDVLSDDILPTLKEGIAGKTEAESANMLINFVQTAFEYMTDEEQFGYERPFFVDETFYYPYSDCEDRAILYSNLVRRLLHLDVVLLHYPKHLATAVRFTSNVEGDYVMVNGQKYTVCDPTYIGADIGEAMPQFKNSEVEIVKFY